MFKARPITKPAGALATLTLSALLMSCAPAADTNGPGGSGGSNPSATGGHNGTGGQANSGGTTGSGGAVSASGGSAAPSGTGGRSANDGTGGNQAPAGSGGAVGSGGNGGTSGGAGRAGSGGRVAAGGTTGTVGGSGSGGAIVSGPPSQPKALTQCRFHFGTLDSKARSNNTLKAQVDYVTPGWVGQSDKFDMASVCTAAKSGGNLAGIPPAVVAYVIAFAARRDQGLQDCNVSGSTNLCKYGATYLRAHLEDRVLPIYETYAKGFASSCGTTMPILWLMEPDYYQYSTGGDAQSLTAEEAGQIMGRLVAKVRQSLPNAIFSLDISPWIPNNGRDWYSHFNMNDFAFINTSGGGTDADNVRIRAANTMTWAGVHQVTGKPILADTGYGVAGSPTGHDSKWDVVANLNARIADGVVGISQYNPNSNWGDTITQIRSQLTAIPCQ